MLTKFVELAEVELTVRHLTHLFALSFYRGMMLNLCHRRGRCLVVKMLDKANCQFLLNFFFVKIEDVVANADGFPEA